MPGPGSDISIDIPAKTGADSPYGDTEGLCAEYEDIGGFTPGVIPGGGLYTGPGGLGGGGGFGGPGSGGGGTDSPPAEPAPDFSTLEDWPIDAIDETTEIAVTDTYMLTGQNISSPLSATTPGCIDTEQMDIGLTIFPVTKGFVNSAYGWDDVASMPAWAVTFQYSMDNAIAIVKYDMSSQFVDPEVGIQGVATGLAMYAHASPGGTVQDPDLSPSAAYVEGDDYGDEVLYENPFDYNEAEEAALEAKFGYYDPSVSPDLFEGTIERIREAMGDLVDAMATGYTARANITRTTPPLKITDAMYEEISSSEIDEEVPAGSVTGTNRVDTAQGSAFRAGTLSSGGDGGSGEIY